MPDLSCEISSFGYIDPEAYGSISENDRKAIQLYNKAIDDIKAGNEDIAFIKLKKAVSAKSDLYEAKLIIGLYYTKTGSEYKAVSVFEDIIRNNKEYGAEALRYIRMLNAGRERTKSDAIKTTARDSHSKNTGRYLLFIMGVIIGIAACTPFLFSKGTDDVTSTDYMSVISSQDELISDYEEMISDLEESVAGMESEIGRLQSETDVIVVDYELSEEEKTQLQDEARSGVIDEFFGYLEILGLYNDGKYLEAADLMMDYMDNNSIFTGEMQEDLDAAYSDMMDKAARYCEDRGVNLYEDGRYDESLSILRKTTTYRPNYQRMYRVDYYIGKNLMAMGDYEAAREMFLEVTRIAPNNDWITYANLRLNEIDEIVNGGNE